MINKRDLLLKNELNNNLDLLNKALDTFLYSYNNCKKIGVKEKYTYEELDKYEALTARFARISDILTQKIMKTVFLLIREDAKTFIDKINMSEKLGIIENSDDLKIIRDLRNEITHEYCKDDISQIFESILEYSPLLLRIIDSFKAYIKKIIS